MANAKAKGGSQFDSFLNSKKPVNKSEEAAAQVVRPKLAKSKDDRFKGTYVYLLKTTVAEAVYQLKKSGDSRDLSGLTEELLAAWVAGQQEKQTGTKN